MSITLELGLETEQQLRKFSTQKGVDLEQFVAELIKEHLDT
jgi:hypothetical protein